MTRSTGARRRPQERHRPGLDEADGRSHEGQGQRPCARGEGLNTHQGLLTAIWTDERFSATCVTMMNTDQVNQNAEAARKFKPLKEADIHELRDAVLAAGPMMCADCDGRCACAAGTNARLGDLARFLTYHEHHGSRSGPRGLRRARPTKSANWQAPTSKPPAKLAPASSTSPSFCPRSIACWGKKKNEPPRTPRKGRKRRIWPESPDGFVSGILAISRQEAGSRVLVGWVGAAAAERNPPSGDQFGGSL